MSFIHTRGVPQSRIWLICEKPLSTDIPKGYLFSGGLGYVFEKMLEEAGLNIGDFYICCRRPDTDNTSGFVILENQLHTYQPPLILVMDEAASYYLPELKLRGEQDDYKGQLNKYCGSLLKSPLLKFPHYMMPIYGMTKFTQDWTERNVTTYIDLQKLRDEMLYWRTHGCIQPLPQRLLLSHDMSTEEILSYFDRFSKATYLSEDIESVYPRRGNAFYQKHPGYPITLGIADSAEFGISFNLFRETPKETRELWRRLDALNYDAQIIGQNFFNFDALFIEALGFRLRRENFHDTLLRHHILWPELPHKLQFLTRQYTREPYYKDQGKQWSMKDMHGLRHYNCLDVTVTYEVFTGQEEEFKLRPHLAA